MSLFFLTTIEEVEKEISLIDSNVKFNIELFASIIAISVAIAFGALWIWAKNWFKKKVNTELLSLKERYDKRLDSLEKQQSKMCHEISSIGCSYGTWTPNFNGCNIKSTGEYYLIHRNIVSLTFCCPIPNHIEVPSIEPLFIGGIPFVSNILLSGDISVIFKDGSKKFLKVMPCNSTTTLFYLVDNNMSAIRGTDLSNVSIITGTLLYETLFSEQPNDNIS